MLSHLLVFVLGGLFLLLSADGARLVFRGTRDHFAALLLPDHSTSRLALTAAVLASVAVTLSGVAMLITLVAWLGGMRPVWRRADTPNPTA